MTHLSSLLLSPPRGSRSQLVAWLVLLFLLASQPHLLVAQTIGDVTPRTVVPGQPTQLKVQGKDLAAGLRATLSSGTVQVDEVTADSATLSITLPPEAAGGVGLWLFTDAGPADPVSLIADALPTVTDTGANHTAETAQLLSLPCAVDGTSDGPQADWYRFHAVAGQRLACEVLTSELHSSMDPLLVLRDAQGRQLLMADDDATGPESRFAYRFEAEGDYFLELQESRHVAGGRYHLRIGDFPLAVACHPLAVTRGVATSLSFTAVDAGDSLLPSVERTVSADDTRQHLSVAVTADGHQPAWSRVLVTDVPETVEEQATGVLSLPVGVSGRLAAAGECDRYTLPGTTGRRLRIRTQTRSLGCPTLATLRLLSSDGTVIAETAPNESDEWMLEATLPHDEDVQLEVRDLLGRGGLGFGYHLEIAEAPGFTVALAGDAKTKQTFAVTPSAGGAAIPLAITREGNDGPLRVALTPAPPGLELLNSEVPAGAKEHRVFLRATDAWQPTSHQVLRLTAAAIDAEGPSQTVSSLAVQRAREPRVPFPAAWREGALAAGSVPPGDPFFSLDAATAEVARPLRTHPVSLALTRHSEAFKGTLTLLDGELPDGWSLSSKAEGETYTATLTRSDAAEEHAEVALLAYGELGGQGRLARVPVTLNWIDPLALKASARGPFIAGRDNPLPLSVTRHGSSPSQPVTLTITAAPPGWPVPPPLTIAAESTAAELMIGVPANASPDEPWELTYTAASNFGGQDFTISGTLALPRIIPAPAQLEVFPAAIELATQADERQLVVTGVASDGSLRDWTADVTLRSSDPAVVEIQGSRVVAVGDGQAVVEARVGDLVKTVAVRVQGSDVLRPVAFESEVMVALSKQGCSSGACHGSPSGKGLFRLSLRGFDPVLDQLTLIREDHGRRVNTFEPAESLLLAKPLMQVSHGGGKQLHTDDVAYGVLRRWIAEGAHADPPDAPRCVGIELYPGEKRVLALAGGQQQLAVLARFADGSTRDVTALAAYESSSSDVAAVDAHGHVRPEGRGETVILARFLEHIESVPLTFLDPDPAFVWQAPPTHNVIDELVDAKLRLLEYTPSPLCTDDEFLRRVSLDVIGVLPTVEESRAFLADHSATKREALIDALLEREEYASYQALRWGDILRMTAKAVGDDGVYKYHRWVEDAFRQNMPYDQFARAILAAEGSTLANPPANFYRAAATATDCVETVSQVFLGARLQCAKCHNHPFEKWTQDNYYGLAAFFEPVQRRTTQRPGETFIYTKPGDGVVQPRTGERMRPWLPGEGTLDLAAGEDGRARLVDWLVREDNPLFARIEANRIWKSCFARGIVDPIDDFRESNPPANGPLLDELTRFFIESGFDRKALLRLILRSRTYQASVASTPSNREDVRYFSHQTPRLLAAEQLLDAIGQVTEMPETFAGLPADTKATQLPAPDLAEVEFLEVFGQPQRSTVCACERSGDSNLGMAIAMFNGEMIHAKLAAEGNRFRRALQAGQPVDAVLDELYLAAVCRLPDDLERKAALAHVASRESPADGLEDVCWALLNTDEFLFQH